MKVLIGCEESQVVAAEFIKLGHDAWSCDRFYPGRKGLPHYQCDVREVLHLGWDLAIFHTPCTYLSNSGIKHLYVNGRKENGRYEPRWELMRQDAQLFLDCWNAPIPMICMENPRPHPYALEIIGCKSDQVIQPYMFGHPETKETHLWLKNLPKLRETNNVYEEMLKLPEREKHRIHHMPPSKTRQRDRSVTYRGIAEAFADQFGGTWWALENWPTYLKTLEEK